VLAHYRWRVVHFNVTERPTTAWTARQLVDAFPDEFAPAYLLGDRDCVYDAAVARMAPSGSDAILAKDSPIFVELHAYNQAVDRPTLVLVHGAASSAGAWRFWRERLEAEGYPTRALDLRGHGWAPCADLERVSMGDYVAAVVGGVPRPPVLVGWSMGGLLALMYGAVAATLGVLALGPSTPGPLLERPASRAPEFRAPPTGGWC
jgi:pimeloyl-ACP methyl ester carboxylesterase